MLLPSSEYAAKQAHSATRRTLGKSEGTPSSLSLNKDLAKDSFEHWVSGDFERGRFFTKQAAGAVWRQTDWKQAARTKMNDSAQVNEINSRLHGVELVLNRLGNLLKEHLPIFASASGGLLASSVEPFIGININPSL